MAAKTTKKRKTISKKGTRKTAGQPDALRGEIIIFTVLAVCILLMISNFGYGGLVGNAVSSVLFGICGWMAYLVPVVLFVVIAFLISNKGNTHAYMKAAAASVLSLLLMAFLELSVNDWQESRSLAQYYQSASRRQNAGGLLGGCVVKVLCPLIGVAGTYVVLVVLGIICVILITEKSLLKPLGKGSRKVYEDAKKRRDTKALQGKKEQNQPSRRQKKEKVSGVSFDTTLTAAKSPDVRELKPDMPKVPDAIQSPFAQEEDRPEEELVINRPQERKDRKKPAASERKTQEEDIPDVKEMEGQIKKQEASSDKKYEIPPLSLLSRGGGAGGDSDAHLRATAKKLEQTLLNFGVKVRVTNASCGPSVTRYELQPEQGVKVSKIVGLSDDIKLNLAVPDIRIEAPIPGKAAVGIEVPNSENAAVMLRDLLESPEFRGSKAKLAFAVGKDIAGKTIVADIAKMPHLLVAGATGSGKSVCINTIIMSIIYRSDPADVKLIMVDPKVVELNVYNGIPHLLIPVVTDPRKAAGALNWAVAEMMKRYQAFAEQNVRDLKGYNEKARQSGTGEGSLKKMPQIIIIVDELADLMMVAPKDVEGAICRLAQLARAAGIHLILATQRPSVNVITGLIKANMPSRIAFAVSSGVDSRTIIDMNGAEKLLGKGDMLFYPSGYPKPVRVQGSFISDKEVQNVVDYVISHNGGAAYSQELEEQMSAEMQGEGTGTLFQPPGASEEGDARDHYFADAGRLIIDKEKASIGMLQRMFKIGFNRAARIMDQLAENGVVGPEEGTKPRKILMTKDQFEELLTEKKQ